ncbi:MFS transporter [Micromonospora andamanensis]|uniref:MFS transporter n=1 Tax=Micromonospora andamanensis TaxID=1287068 RepID=UPI0019514EC9|nr:MFS transporter [Micromonospora andamanensis]
MNTSAAADLGRRAGLREWIGLAVLALPTILLSLDATVLYLATPHLGADLRPDSNQLLWIVDVYGFMIAGFLLTMGSLGDRIGRRKLLMIGAIAFGAASVMAAYAPTPEALIAARALLGIAGATLMPSTLALISNMFRDSQQRAMAIGLWVACFSVGIAVGPIAGGLLLEAFWWGSVFLLGVPVMVVLLVAAPVLLPEYRNPQAGRLDVVSVLLSLGAVLPVVYAVKEFAKSGFELLPVVALTVGVVVGIVFGRRQNRLADPLLDLRLFRERSFNAALAILLLGLGVMGGVYLYVTQYLQLVEGLSPMMSGLWLLPAALALIVASWATPLIARRISSGYVVAGALALSGLGYLMISQVNSAAGLPLLVAGFILVYVGTSPTMVLGTDLVVGAAPPEKAGSASAISESAMEFGLALGVAVLGVVGASAYRNEMAGIAPADVPPAAYDAARDSFVAAHGEAATLAEGPAASLLEAARNAFVGGMSLVSWISVATVALLAVIAVANLRHVPPTSESGAEEQTTGAPVPATPDNPTKHSRDDEYAQV